MKGRLIPASSCWFGPRPVNGGKVSLAVLLESESLSCGSRKLKKSVSEITVPNIFIVITPNDFDLQIL